MCTFTLKVNMFVLLIVLLLLLSKCNSLRRRRRADNSDHMNYQENPDFVYPGEVSYPNPHYHHPPHFHHHPPPHRHPPGMGHGPPGQYEPEDTTESELQRHNAFDNSTMVPLSFIQEINSYENVADLLLNYVDGEYEAEAPGFLLSNRFGDGERSAATIPKSAVCMPELKTVSIAVSDDPSVVYIPSCTRVERCGGCCSHSLLACQPKQTETVSFQVVKTQFVGGRKLKFMGKEIVLVEKHTKCTCDCKVRPEDCNRFQEYRKSECRCACTNLDEEKKCYKDNATKLWNPDNCSCQCRDILQCSTGLMFDSNRCRCVPILVRRRFAEESVENEPQTRKGYKSEGLPVVPLE